MRRGETVELGPDARIPVRPFSVPDDKVQQDSVPSTEFIPEATEKEFCAILDQGELVITSHIQRLTWTLAVRGFKHNQQNGLRVSRYRCQSNATLKRSAPGARPTTHGTTWTVSAGIDGARRLMVGWRSATSHQLSPTPLLPTLLDGRKTLSRPLGTIPLSLEL